MIGCVLIGAGALRVEKGEIVPTEADLFGQTVHVYDVGGYVGSSTKSEIEYAIAHGKKVRYLEEP
ncbi:hypothetical protein [Butyrivibrio sp. YAB3001]|uniref:hypothetical protein n=1 Tax=Butyrivibrio sp. YAB3001 TaxID=1520812 RepID=UPI0008F675C9|nr:hypothetical protein [Butyrivibrio sp. YAB3001]SFC01878.1 hypothetical protein SAMN02910398_01332 [Butyrivibrio sp. YAB3001]